MTVPVLNLDLNRILPRAILLAAGLTASATLQAAEPSASIKYLEPRTLNGRIYADAGLKKLLFTFRRTATNHHSHVHVLREFLLPDGALAARERVVYDRDVLSSFHLEDLQTGEQGSVRIDPVGTHGRRIRFEYTVQGDRKTASEEFQANTLTSDMVAPFLLDHWTSVTNGAAVKCRLIALSRLETVEFTVLKESERTLNGSKVTIIRMEPSSWLVAQFVQPLRFTVRHDRTPRILQYFGRTTPSIRHKGKWTYLEAFSVFDAP